MRNEGPNAVKRLMCAYLIALLTLGVGKGYGQAAEQRQIDSLKHRVSQLERQLEALQKELDELRRELHVPIAVQPSPIPEALRGSEHVRYGFPGGSGRVLDKHYFIIDYDGHLKIPRWVGYHLTREELEENVAARNDWFRPDPELPLGERAELTDYRNSGYDRGHQAPAADFHRSEEAMKVTFLLSNMCPQWPSLNRGSWARLEDQVPSLAKHEGSVWVYTGALFLDEMGRQDSPQVYIGPDSVAVPTHFFEVIMVEHSPTEHEMFAFLLRNQEAPLPAPTTRYQVTVDSVQRVSGLDFFDVLPDDEEMRLEHQINHHWEAEAAEPSRGQQQR